MTKEGGLPHSRSPKSQRQTSKERSRWRTSYESDWSSSSSGKPRVFTTVRFRLNISCIQLNNLAKKMDKLEPGEFVDVLDCDGRWCLCTVLKPLSVRPGCVHVHYEGWGDNWNEAIPWSSGRLAPPLSKTGHLHGQTGEVDGRGRVLFYAHCKVGDVVQAYDKGEKEWKMGSLTKIATDGIRRSATLTVQWAGTDRSCPFDTKEECVLPPKPIMHSLLPPMLKPTRHSRLVLPQCPLCLVDYDCKTQCPRVFPCGHTVHPLWPLPP